MSSLDMWPPVLLSMLQNQADGVTTYYDLCFTTRARAAEVGPICNDFPFYEYKLGSFKDIIGCDG
jgi:hypothetical protein